MEQNEYCQQIKIITQNMFFHRIIYNYMKLSKELIKFITTFSLTFVLSHYFRHFKLKSYFTDQQNLSKPVLFHISIGWLTCNFTKYYPVI